MVGILYEGSGCSRVLLGVHAMVCTDSACGASHCRPPDGPPCYFTVLLPALSWGTHTPLAVARQVRGDTTCASGPPPKLERPGSNGYEDLDAAW